MKKFICTVCGYIYEGETAPENVLCVKLLLLNSKKWKKQQKVACSLLTNTLSV